MSDWVSEGAKNSKQFRQLSSRSSSGSCGGSCRGSRSFLYGSVAVVVGGVGGQGVRAGVKESRVYQCSGAGGGSLCFRRSRSRRRRFRGIGSSC